MKLFCAYRYLYLCRLEIKKYADRKTDIHSAAGTDSHTPATSRNRGSRRMLATMNTKVRAKEIPAETAPSENAVNMEEAKILIPANR